MPPRGVQVFKLAKHSDEVILWQIEVVNNTTTVQGGPADRPLKEFPPISHASARAASNHALQQVRKKHSQGFERVDLPQSSAQLTDLRQRIRGRPGPSRHEDNLDCNDGLPASSHGSRYAQDYTSSRGDNHASSRYSYRNGRSQRGPYQPPHARNDIWVNPGESQAHDDYKGHTLDADDYVQSDHDTDPLADTDSVSSSVIGNDGSRPERRKRFVYGVSPLNRRRSARLLKMNTVQMKSPVEELGFLVNTVGKPGIQSQNTVIMGTPMERMETGTKWLWRRNATQNNPASQSQSAFGNQPKVQRRQSARWRGAKKQETVTLPAAAATTTNADDEDEIDGGQKPSLLTKMTTTTTLRSLFGGFDIKRPSSSAATEAESGMLGTSRAGLRRTGSLKRMSTVLSPTSPGNAPLKKVLKKTMTKKVTIMTPAENHDASVSGIKRGSDAIDQSDTPPRGGKKSCVRPALRRRGTSLFGVQIQVYTPPEETWPVDMRAPVVWAVPLSQGSDKLQGRAVHVSAERCLIAADNGTVVELNGTVTPTHLYHLPAAANCLLPDSDFLYAGCEDGGVYDITHQVPRLLFSIKGFGQVLCVAVSEGAVAVSDQHGKVALVNHDGSLAWKKKSKGEFGWMVRVDRRAVYHGHSKGVTAYAREDGSQLWHYATQDSVLSGSMTSEAILVSCGTSVLKLDKMTSDVLSTYDQAGAQTGTIHSSCQGSGFIFAGGNNIACYDEDSGQLVYRIQHDFKPTAMQYFRGRLFCIGQGALSVIDLTEKTVRSVQAGQAVTTTLVHPDPRAPSFTPLQRQNTVRVTPGSPEAQGVVVECVKPTARRGKLLARALSKGFNKTWEVQLPSELWSEGTKYVVEDLRPCPHANYYRVFGSIHELGE